MKSIAKPNHVTKGLFTIYLVALFWVIVLKFNISAYYVKVTRSFNWIPYREFIRYGNLDLNEALLNVFIFVPFGFFAGILLVEWKLGKKLVLFLFVSFLFEISQYILKFGAFDVTDLINNTLGGLLGLMIIKGLETAFNGRIQAQKFINILSMLGMIFLFSFLLFLKLNNLWIFRMELLQQ